jgi:aspartate carbamoyltransferase catalytic subunit
VLAAVGARVSSLSIPTRFDPVQVARQIAALGGDLVLFSNAETGSAARLRSATAVPLLNAGDGVGENPVRALMDAFAIRTTQVELGGLRVAVLGNLKFSGEAHSLARLLALYDVRLSLVTPAALSMPYDLTDDLRAAGIEVEETNDLEATLRKADVLYLALIDPVRVEKKLYDKWRMFYALDDRVYAEAKPGLLVLGDWHDIRPLEASRPRVQSTARAMLYALVESVRP